MKKLTILLLCLGAFTACKKENSTLSKLKKATQEVKNATNVISGLDEAGELTEKLKKLEPLSKEAWKKWIPENLKTLKRKTYKIGSNGLGDMSSAKLEYRDTEVIKKSLKLEIIDGAGNGSGIVYMYKMAANMKLDAESERGYDKIHKRDGVTIKEKYRKQTHTNSTKMEFLMNERFVVNVTGYNMEPDEMWRYLKALNIEDLKE